MSAPLQRRIPRWAIFAVALAGMLAYVTGLLHGGRIEPGAGKALPGESPPGTQARAERSSVPVVEDAVGTIQSRRQVSVAAQTVARVREVGPQVGDAVHTGDLLVRLDDAEVAARFARAQAAYERVRRFVAAKAATAQQFEAVEAEFREARAGMEHTRIVAPLDGVVAERHVEPGDLAAPGRPLLVVFDPTALRVDARVREGVVGRLAAGTRVSVVLPATGRAIDGIVSAVVPAADARSRTFEVRVDVPASPGLHPGMFARLRVPVGEREVVRIPAPAVTRVGQMETVLVLDDGAWRRRLVTTGEPLADGTVEVLSGLAGGEAVGLPATGPRP
jgi:RND family efflux transporter MFP subunit